MDKSDRVWKLRGEEHMLVRVLGEVSLLSSDGSVVPLRGSSQSALLAALAARAGQVVSVERLVDLLWGESPPDNPAAALHSAVFKLRASLTAVSRREVLRTRDPGYALELEPGDLDAEVFLAHVRDARDQPVAAGSEILEQALSLWRGPAYGEFADSEVAQLDAIQLEEQRRAAIERCAEMRLVSGRPGDAVRLLQPFVAEQPLREAARITLMRALDATGRTAEALEQYHEHRKHLADELGLEPSHALRSLQSSLLRGSDSPDRLATSSRARSGEGLNGMEVRYLRTQRGNVVAYGTTGVGPKIVVLLGWVSSLDVIASGRDPRSSLLERLTGDVALTLYDRAGTGLSPDQAPDYGLEGSVAELTEVVRTIGPPVSLLAMSSCGPVAVAFAHARPDWVDSMVMFGTFASGPATFTDERLKQMVVEIARTHWGIGSKMLADLYRPGLSDDAAWHLAKVFRDSATPEVAAAYLETIYGQDVTPLLPEIETPTLVLHYRSDRLIRFRGGQDLTSGLPNATLVPLDGRVHLPDAADLDTIEQAIVAHVRRHASR
jgi:DNA-binding SARP family transcriptional activator/pimeloyl-ACP methyl ester carboxylesterase